MQSKRTTDEGIEVRCLVSDLRIERRDGDGPAAGRTVTGYAAVFERWSEPICGWFREQIARGAFEGCDLEDVILCFNHDPSALLARTASGTLSLEVDERGLKFSFEAPDTTLGNDMLELVRRGDVSKCSFRFTVKEDRWVYADAENGMEYDERTVLKIAKLYDAALVVYPAYRDTEASVRALEARKAEHLRRRAEPDAGAGSGSGAGTDCGPEPLTGANPGAGRDARSGAVSDPAVRADVRPESRQNRDAGANPDARPADGADVGTNPAAGAAWRLREREVQFYQLKK